MAGFTVNVRTNAHDVAIELLADAQDVRDKAMARALNKMAAQVKTQAAREVRDAGYQLKVAEIKSALKIVKATPGSLRATVIGSGRPIPLIKYGARQTSKGVSVSVQKGRKLIQDAFIATMPNGHVGVFVRKPDARHKKMSRGGKTSWHALPIRELFGPAIPDALANAAVQSALQSLIEDKFPAIFEHECAWLARSAKG